MRLLLRSGANPQVENNNGKTPIDIAKERGHALCEEMVWKGYRYTGFKYTAGLTSLYDFQLMHSLHRKKTMFDNVNIDWHLTHEDGSTDFSDDEMLEEYPRLNGSRTPEHLLSSPDRDAYLRTGSRPFSVYHSSTTPNRGSMSINRSSDWITDRGPSTLSTWNKSTSETGDSPRMHHTLSNNMPPPPPPQSKKPGSLCKFLNAFNDQKGGPFWFVPTLKYIEIVLWNRRVVSRAKCCFLESRPSLLQLFVLFHFSLKFKYHTEPNG